MTMHRVLTPTGHHFVHPFVAGKRKEELRVPTEITDPKTGKVRQGWRCVADGALKAVPKAGKRTT
jgi:hypothetical protein